MSIPVFLVDSAGRRVDVDKTGALRISDGPYDLTKFVELAAAATAYNYYPPKVGCQFVMTGLLAFADRNVSDADDTIITIYEGTAPNTTTVSRGLLQFGMGKLTTLPYPSIRILVNPGVWINAKTDDDNIFLNIIGHYIPIIQNPVE